MTYRDHSYASACGQLQLFARDYGGDGPPLLLMHGLTRNSADFEPLAAHLAASYRLIVPDQRGRGRSDYDPDPANYRPDIYSQDMFALMDDLQVTHAHLIGTSMGGMMAMIMAAIKPDSVGAVVLNDIGAELDPSGLARIASYVGPSEPFADLDAAAKRIAEINRHAFTDFNDTDWLEFARRTTRIRDDGQVEFAYDPAIAHAFEDAEAGQPDLWPVWKLMGERPVLLIRGAHSDLLSPGTAARMGREHAGEFELVEVPHRGHAPLLDEPEALGAITAFLERHVR